MPPSFDEAFRGTLAELFAWRRDVRRFRPDPLPDGMLQHLLRLAHRAPSVGNAQPWRFAIVADPTNRAAVRASFETANADALAGYDGEQAQLYASLKLEGLSQAPDQLAVFTDTATGQGHGLGRRTMPETLTYSTVCAIHTLWLAARAEGIGVGWLSILDPEAVTRDLAVPESWRLVAYLCVGYPVAEDDTPALETAGWQARTEIEERIIRR